MSGTNYIGSQAAAPYASVLASAAAKYGVPVDLLTNQIGQESSFDPTAHNPTPGSTATGLGQFIASTAANVPGYGALNPLDPVASINASAAYDASLYQKTGSWLQALQSYGTLTQGVHGSILEQQAIDADNGVGTSNSAGVDTSIASATPAQTAAAGSAVKSAQITTNILGIFEEYFVRAVLIILGLIFVAVGLTMFKNPVGDAITAGAKLVPKAIPIPV